MTRAGVNCGFDREGEHMRKQWIHKDFALFRGGPQIENFRDMARVFPVRVVRRSDAPQALPSGTEITLPRAHHFDGVEYKSEAFLEETETVGLLVLHAGRRVYERYWHGVDAATQWPIWSVTKSFVSTLVGNAVANGYIRSLDDAISEYVPKLRGSAYEGVPVRHVLQMSSGARWTENYADPESDVARRREAIAGGSFDAVVSSCVREHASGTVVRYNTNDTHALGMLLRRVLRKPLVELLQEQLWNPLGMQHPAFWRIDGEGAEDAGAGLHAALGDIAKLGQLYLDGGVWNGKPLAPAQWVAAATRPDGAHAEPGAALVHPFGYGYQWWLTGRSGAYAAIGAYNQYLYVNPRQRVVIAKLSANRNFARSYDEAGYRDQQHTAFFEAVAQSAHRN